MKQAINVMDPVKVNKQSTVIGHLNGKPVYSVSGGHDTFALDQDSFRARNDNGTETTATWIAAANTNWTQDVDVNFRVRFLVQESGAGTAAGTFGGQLQYNLNTLGWNNVTGASSVVKAVASPNIADGVATTQQIGAGTFVAGSIDEVDGNIANVSLAGDDETEAEYVLQIVGADVSNSDSIQLRVIGLGDDTTVLSTYTNTPTITANKATPAGATLTGVAGTSATGNAKGNISVGLTGVLATAAVGTLTAIKSFALAGVLATASVGSVGFTESGTVGLTGNAGTSAVGSISQSRTVSLSGVSATSAVGTVSASVSAGATLTGVSSTSAVGSVGVTKSGSLALTGVQGTSSVGSVGFTESGNVGLTGVQGTSAVGSVTASFGATQALTGVSANSAVGSVAPESSVSISGNASVGAVGSVAAVSGAGAALTGVSATSAVGSMAASGDGEASVTSSGSSHFFGVPSREAVERHYRQLGLLPELKESAKITVDSPVPRGDSRAYTKYPDYGQFQSLVENLKQPLKPVAAKKVKSFKSSLGDFIPGYDPEDGKEALFLIEMANMNIPIEIIGQAIEEVLSP